MYTLLIADDEADERNLLRFLLKNYQTTFRMIEASNGKEALSIIQKEHVDILLSDIQMPFLNGIELATEAKALFPDIEILFFSGYDDFSYVQNALSLQAVNYILKPVNPEEFHNSLNVIIKRLDSKLIQFANSEQYIETNFYANNEKMDADHLIDSDKTSEEDSFLLQNIKLAIKFKQPDKLHTLVHELLNKYNTTQQVSHIYIRYICTSLLQALMSACMIPYDSEFEMVAKKIYTLKHFYDIQYLIEKYLDHAVSAIREELDGNNYAINQVKNYINQHYKDDLSLSMLADIVYLSPNYLSNIFAKTTGESINKYIRQVRLGAAQALLLNTNMKINDISLNVGYPNSSYFCKLFQKQFGTTPDKFRNPLI